MHEANGGTTGVGEGDYRPRHAAPQLEDWQTVALANATDMYRYEQLHRQYDAEFAIIRAQLRADSEAGEDKALIESLRQIVAESIGQQAAAKAYADGLRAELYYDPPNGVPYHGRHRLEDRVTPEDPGAEPGPKHAKEEALEEAPQPPPDLDPPEGDPDPPSDPSPPADKPKPPPAEPVAWSPQRGAPEQGSKYSNNAGAALSKIRPAASPEPPSKELPVNPLPAVAPPQKEAMSIMDRVRHAWYAGVAATTLYFSNPEKGRRRRLIAAGAALLGLVAAGGVAGWLHGHWHDWFHHPGQPPHPPQEVGPTPNSEQFFDTIKPTDYHGEPYEWTFAANHSGPAQATPHLLREVNYARSGGLHVDTWGSPDQGQWGINSVTVRLPDGTYKSYYDTPRKLAILQWYAGGMGPKV